MKFHTMSVREIEEFLKVLPVDQWLDASETLSNDSRKAVQKLGESLGKKFIRMELEQARLETMVQNQVELSLGAKVLCGVDEAGRGPLAGPVVAGAVILPDSFRPLGLNDSKKISEALRESLYDQIIGSALAWGVGIVGPERIDEINILEATREAMIIAIGQMRVKPDFVLLDAVEIKALTIPHRGIIKGDEKCLSIAAASILAKVTRDRLMVELGRECPGYGFEIHKGYGTPMHYDGLKKQGVSRHHRASFLKNWQE